MAGTTRHCSGIAALLILVYSGIAIAEKPTILVGHIQAKIKARKLKDREFIETKLTTRIRLTAGDHVVTSMGDLSSQLEFEHMREQLGCDTQACLAEIAGSTGSDFVVFPKLLQRGRRFYFQITLIDRRRSSVVRSSSLIKFKWSDDAFESAIERAVREVFGGSVASQSPPARSTDPPGTRSSTPQTGVLVISSAPAGTHGAVVLLDGKVRREPTPATIADVPAGEHRVAVRASGYREWRRKVTVKRDAVTRVLAKLKPAPGGLKVDTGKVRGAAVHVDGKARCTTPCSLDDLEPGRHTVRVVRKGFRAWEDSVMVSSDRVATRKLRLERETGKLLVESKPTDAQVLLDGTELGRTPLEVEVRPGEYVVGVEAGEAYWPHAKRVLVTTGGTSRVQAMLERKKTRLEVAANVDGAQVLVDGEARGLTPLVIEDLAPGSHRVVAEAPPDLRGSDIVALALGRQDRVVLKLLGARERLARWEEERQTYQIWGWVLTGTAAALAVGSAIFIGVGASEQSKADANYSDFQDRRTIANADEVRTAAEAAGTNYHLAWGLGGAAAAALVGGIVAFALSPEMPEGAAHGGALLVPGVLPSDTGVVVSLGVRR